MEEANAITVTPAPTGHRGNTKGSEVTTYNLKLMTPEQIKLYGLEKYVKQ